jgi:hypothetical protein
MRIALFIGDHTKDNPSVRLGWCLTRLVQKGEFSDVTHIEAILAEHEDGTVTIGSASIRDGGVRTKRCALTPEHWLIVDVPKWSVVKARKWFADHEGEPYDTRGAFATAFPIQWAQENHWFCNQAVGASVGMNSPEIFGPSQFAAICHSFKNAGA